MTTTIMDNATTKDANGKAIENNEDNQNDDNNNNNNNNNDDDDDDDEGTCFGTQVPSLQVK